MKENFKIIKKINNVNLLVSDEDRLPVKPFCDAMGINFKSQYDKLKEDELYASTMVLSTTVAGDEKERDMVTLPFEYLMMWLGSINPKNVKPEAQEAVSIVRSEIVKAIAFYFKEYKRFVVEKQKRIERKFDELDKLQGDFVTARKNITSCKQQLLQIRTMTFEEWQSENSQQTIPYGETTKE